MELKGDKKMSYAFIVVDMLKGSFTNPDAPLTKEARKIIPVIQTLLEKALEKMKKMTLN